MLFYFTSVILRDALSSHYNYSSAEGIFEYPHFLVLLTLGGTKLNNQPCIFFIALWCNWKSVQGLNWEFQSTVTHCSIWATVPRQFYFFKFSTIFKMYCAKKFKCSITFSNSTIPYIFTPLLAHGGGKSWILELEKILATFFSFYLAEPARIFEEENFESAAAFIRVNPLKSSTRKIY